MPEIQGSGGAAASLAYPSPGCYLKQRASFLRRLPPETYLLRWP